MLRPRSLLRAHRDERLVAQLREGNERAFEALFERYRARLLAFCRGMLHSSEDAEDVLQEVFTAAHAALLADDREIEVRPWLYRIARNRCLNHMRRPQPESQASMDAQPHRHGASTEEHAAEREDLRALVLNIRDLPEAQRSALLLRELEALSYGEIAASLETSVPAVKSLLVRARMGLAEASQASELSCADVRFELAAAAEGIRKASGPVRHHARRCGECDAYRRHLRSTSRGLAALAPIGPLLMLKRLLGAKLSGSGGGGAGAAGAGGGGASGTAGGLGTGAAATGAGAGAGAAGGGAAAVTGLGLVSSKAIAGAAAAALIGGGAVTVAAPELPVGNPLVAAINSGKSQVAGIAGAEPANTTSLRDRSVRAERRPAAAGQRGDEASAAEDDPAAADDDTGAQAPAEDAPAEGAEGLPFEPTPAQRERLRALMASDRQAARQWWRHLRAMSGGGEVPSAPPMRPPRPAPRPPASDPPPSGDPEPEPAPDPGGQAEEPPPADDEPADEGQAEDPSAEGEQA